MSARPEDPSVVVYAPASQLIAVRSDRSYVTMRAGSGLVSVKGNLLNYTDYWGRSVMNIYLKDIQAVSVKRAFVDGPRIQYPCYCPCVGCPDGVVDIRATMSPEATSRGVEFHVGLAMPSAEEFAEKLNAEINKTS